MGPDVFGIAVYRRPRAPRRRTSCTSNRPVIGLPDEAYYREDHYAPIREAYVEMVAERLASARLVEADEEADPRTGGPPPRCRDPTIAAYHWDNVATRDSQKTYNPTGHRRR